MLNPGPTFSLQFLCNFIDTLLDELLDQRPIIQIAFFAFVEQVFVDCATRREIAINPDKLNAPIGRTHFLLGQQVAQLMRIPRVAVCAIPDTFLLSVIIANGERLQLIQVDFTPAIRLDKSRSHIAEFQPLQDEPFIYPETSRNFFHRLACIDEFTERNELVGGMHTDTERVLGETHCNCFFSINDLAWNALPQSLWQLLLFRK